VRMRRGLGSTQRTAGYLRLILTTVNHLGIDRATACGRPGKQLQ
jgi:hypothetical protein